MGAGHSHGHDDEPLRPASRQVRLILLLAIAPFLIATVVGLWLLWPPPSAPHQADATALTQEFVDATVVKLEATSCGASIPCTAVTVHVESGPDVGLDKNLPNMSSSAGVAPLQVGDKLVVARLISPVDGQPTYNFQDYQRRQPLWLLAFVFAVVVVLIGRWRGLAAIFGLGVTWAVLIWFVIPAILAGSSPIAVALVGSALLMFVVLYLAHGFNARTTTALLGTLVSLSFTGLLAWLFVGLTHLTGITEDTMFLQSTGGPTINLAGLLLGGIVIGSLGVLNDATVTQSSSVWELHHADPSRPARRLYGSGMRIGRDHIASTVYTIVLAYAGAALPLLILFTVNGAKFGDVVTSEVVAVEVIRTMIGSIGLVLSVPITTLIAASVVVRQDNDAPPAPRAVDRIRRAAGGAGRQTRAAAGTAVTRTRTTAGAQREQRREAKAHKVETWEPPRHEREFWDADD